MKNRIIKGDCIEVLKEFKDNTFNMCFADPPYNLQLTQQLIRPEGGIFESVTEDDKWDKFESLQDYDLFTIEWLKQVKRTLKGSGTLWVSGTYHNIFRVGYHLMNLGFWILNDIIWIKTNPPPNFNGVRFQNSHETIIWAKQSKDSRYTFNYKKMKELNGNLQEKDYWFIPMCQGKERIRINGQKAHSTQKPESLLYKIIISSTNEGDLVLDPFFGTGTTGKVCLDTKRNFVGIEKEQKYIEVAQRRLEVQSNKVFY